MKWVNLIFNGFKTLIKMRDVTGKLGKRAWRSKTMWVFGVGLIFSVASVLGWLPTDPATGQPLQFAGDVQLAVTNFVGLILRLITREPVGFIDIE